MTSKWQLLWHCDTVAAENVRGWTRLNRARACSSRGLALETPDYFFFQAEDGIRDLIVTGVQTCALPILALITPRAPSNGWCEPPIAASSFESAIIVCGVPHTIAPSTSTTSSHLVYGRNRSAPGIRPIPIQR